MVLKKTEFDPIVLSTRLEGLRPGRKARAGNKKCERKGGAQNEEDFFIFLGGEIPAKSRILDSNKGN